MLRSSSKRAWSSISTATCLPASASAGEGCDERRVAAGAVEGHLDGDDFGIFDGGEDEAARRELSKDS